MEIMLWRKYRDQLIVKNIHQEHRNCMKVNTATGWYRETGCARLVGHQGEDEEEK
jgi:hypothetical protein